MTISGTSTIAQTVTLPASPERIYNALLDGEQTTAFTGAYAYCQPEEGFGFSAYDDYVIGKILELRPSERIVQTWQAREPNWLVDHFSKVTLELRPQGEGTELTLLHEDVPEEYAASVAEGWHRYYWEPLRKWLSA